VAAPVRFREHVSTILGFDPLLEHPVAVMLLWPIISRFTVDDEGRLLPVIARVTPVDPVSWDVGV
jgi:hypothetical protein